MSRIASCCLLIFFAVKAFAGAEHSNITVKDVIVNSSSGVHFRPVEAMINPDSCTKTNWYKVDPNSTFGKELFSLLLAAKTSNKTVTVYLSGCTSDYPKIEWVF